MSRNYNISVRHENGELSTNVTLLPDLPHGSPIAIVDLLKDTEIENTFKVEKVTTLPEYIGKTVAILTQDILDLDAERKAGK